jgi:hypothetical protein
MVGLALIIGIAVGLGTAWFVLRRSARNATRAEQGARRELDVVRQELAGTRAELAIERRSFDEKVVNAVKAASSDALRANNSLFLELAETKLTSYVKPLKDSLEKVDGP